MKRFLLTPLLALVACGAPPAGERSGPPPEDAVVVREEELDTERVSPLKRATNLFSSGDYVGARGALEELLSEEPEHTQALYLHARTLAFLGEYRGAKADCQAVLALQPDNALAFDLLASLHEHLGEHREAIAAYKRVSERVRSHAQETAGYLRLLGLPVPPGVVSHAPLVGMARCHLSLGEPTEALAALEQARSGVGTDPWVDYWRFVTYSRLKRPEAAETAGRTFLREAGAGFGPQRREVRRYLSQRAQTLSPELRAHMLDYVRAACRLRLPSQTPPEEAVLARSPERLLAFDDRPVFVTVITPNGGPRYFGRGRGKTLASALKGAVEDFKDDPGYRPLLAREAALRIAIGRDLTPAKLVREGGRLGVDPAWEASLHGLALRADGQEVYLLPGDPVIEDLIDLEEALEFACARAGLGKRAWQSAGQAVFRFEAEAFVSSRPGGGPVDLVGAEAQPRPEASLRSLRESLRRGVRFLTRLIQPEAGLPAGYSPTHNRLDSAGADAGTPAPASLAAHAAAIEALARLARRGDAGEGKILLAAAQHLLEHAAKDLAPADLPDATRAALLIALAGLPDTMRGKHQDLADTLARQLSAPPAASRQLAARALLVYSRATGAKRWAATADQLIGELDNLDPAKPRERELLLELARAGKTRATARLQGWAQRALQQQQDGTRRVRDLARVAQLLPANGAQSAALRQEVLRGSGELLALQLDDRHRWFCAAPGRAVGGFRADFGSSHLRPERTSECLLALADVLDLLAK